MTYRSKFLQSDAYKANSDRDRIVISEFGTLALPDPCKNVFERFMSKFEKPGKHPLLCPEFSGNRDDSLNYYDICQSFFISMDLDIYFDMRGCFNCFLP